VVAELEHVLRAYPDEAHTALSHGRDELERTAAPARPC